MIKCIYHGGCPDGFGAAMAVHFFSNAEAELLPFGYHMDPPEPGDPDDELFIVDFSFHPEVLSEMMTDYRQITVFDHHETALDGWSRKTGSGPFEYEHENLRVLIDQSRSGAGIAWDELHGERPDLINYVEDRDLWNWGLPNSREIGCFILTIKHDPVEWAKLLMTPVEELVHLGAGAHAFQEKAVAEQVNLARYIAFGGREFWLTQSPYILGSRTAEAIMETHDTDMAAYWLINPGGLYQYGFRSRNGVTVNDFAKQFGGGGHPQAAGCTSESPLHDLPSMPPASQISGWQDGSGQEAL